MHCKTALNFIGEGNKKEMLKDTCEKRWDIEKKERRVLERKRGMYWKERERGIGKKKREVLERKRGRYWKEKVTI